MATCGAEYWTLNKDIKKRLAVFETNDLKRIFSWIRINEIFRKQYNTELMQLFWQVISQTTGGERCSRNSV